MGHLKWTLETFLRAFFERDDVVQEALDGFIEAARALRVAEALPLPSPVLPLLLPFPLPLSFAVSVTVAAGALPPPGTPFSLPAAAMSRP